MKTFIIEGASTSGKTMLAKRLLEKAKSQGLRCLLVEENQTLIDGCESLSFDNYLNHLFNVLDSIKFEKHDLVIFDRFHISVASITNSPISKFKKLENKLAEYSTHIIFLKVDEKVLPARIIESKKYRTGSWDADMKLRGKNEQEVGEFHIQTHKNLLKALKSSTLPYKIIDATKSDYDRIADKILTLK